MLLLLGSLPHPGFYFFCAVNRTQPIDWFTAFTQLLYNIQMLAENQSEIEKKCRQSRSEEFRETNLENYGLF